MASKCLEHLRAIVDVRVNGKVCHEVVATYTWLREGVPMCKDGIAIYGGYGGSHRVSKLGANRKVKHKGQIGVFKMTHYTGYNLNLCKMSYFTLVVIQTNLTCSILVM